MTNERILLGGAICRSPSWGPWRHSGCGCHCWSRFLGPGMLLGSEGVGGIYFDDAELTRWIGPAGLVLIFFEGGLTMKWGELRPILGPAVVLSTLGVAVTSAVAAAGAWLLFALSGIEGVSARRRRRSVFAALGERRFDVDLLRC